MSMKEFADNSGPNQIERLRWLPGRPDSIFEKIGGRKTLVKVHVLFYQKVFAHQWLGKYFSHRDPAILEEQQTDFMSQNMGGPKIYMGGMPKAVHDHMFVTQELFDIRNGLLSDSIKACGVHDELRETWLGIDKAFASKIVKEKLSDCKGRYVTQEILNFPKP